MPITMAKAIEILDLNVVEAHKKIPPDTRTAICLAISTMKTVRYIRKGGQWDLHALFPDEAPEAEE